MPKSPTQADVARIAGVSRSTVSVVLNNRTDRQINITDDTRHRVWQAARNLGYEPNALAQGLRSGQSYSIGVLVPNVYNLHYLEILDGIAEELSLEAYHLTLVMTKFDPERERNCYHSLFQQRLDGLVLMPTFLDQQPDVLELLSELGRPAVFLTREEKAIDMVLSDIRGGSEALMDHLIAAGHRRIAFVNGVIRPILTIQRQTVYREKLAAAGIPFDESLFVTCGPMIQDAYEAVSSLLELPNRPTAIWTINDILAIGAMRAIHDKHLQIPQDVALAGCDDTDIAAQLSPPLTSIRIPSRLLGRRAARVLLQRIEDPERDPVREILPTELIIRESTAHAPGPNYSH